MCIHCFTLFNIEINQFRILSHFMIFFFFINSEVYELHINLIFMCKILFLKNCPN